MVNLSSIKLFIFSLKIGLKFPWSRLGLTRLLVPMDIARYFEIPATAKALQLKTNDTILDLSSPKLLASYLANEANCNIEATDIYENEIEEWKRLLKISGYSSKKLVWKIVDGRNLPYKSDSFDKAYSISVLEHIEKRGDIRTIKELARIIKPTGLLVITVPVNNSGGNSYKKTSIYGQTPGNRDRFFWSRRYTPETLISRLVNPSGLKLNHLEYCYEQYPFFSSWHARFLPWSILFGWFYPMIAAVSLKRCLQLPKNISMANALLILQKKDTSSKNCIYP